MGTAPQTSALPSATSIETLREQILGDVEKDLDEYITHAQSAIWNSESDSVHTSFDITVAIKKKMVGDEQKISLSITPRERIPKPVIKHEIKFTKTKQLVLI